MTAQAARPRVLVTHPGRQHSHQAAVALERAGLLAGYWSGIPATASAARRLPRAVRRRTLRYAPVALPEEAARWVPQHAIARRLAHRALPRRLAERADFAVCRSFDRWVARRLPARSPSAVLACEISALETFRAARRAGLATLLDAPSLHHRAQDRLHGFSEAPALHRRIVAVKDAEIALADHVLTVSEVARETYLEAGVAPERVHAVMLGADTALFRAAGEGERPADGPVRFVFAGAAIRRKGFDLLVEAFSRVVREVPDARLAIVGPPAELSHLADRLPPAALEKTGPVPQAELAAELRRSDLLVLPSRNDSYGMVVAEALASGTPALVTEMVGSKELIEDGATGWVVPVEDVDALTERLLACARAPETLRAMRPAARAAAEEATWEAYHRRFAALVERLLREDAG